MRDNYGRQKFLNSAQVTSNMDNLMNSNYMKALKSKPLRDVKISTSENKDAMNKQDKKCIRCKKSLHQYLYKFIRNPQTKKMEAVCADCYIQIKKKI